MTPELELQTTFVLDGARRITSTREPQSSRGPLLSIIRSQTACVWAVRDDVPREVAEEIEKLARTEPPLEDLRSAPVHAARYLALTGGRAGFRGPAFSFPEALPAAPDVVLVEDERLLARHFQGWQQGEIAAGRAPVMAIFEGGHPVSLCFCARRSDEAAAAGVETAAAFRGRGLAPLVVAAWAAAVRASGRAPLYSADWTNAASLAVARKLELVAHAAFWNVASG